MIKQEFADKDLQGKRIEQRNKDGHSVEIDGQSRFCGHRFLLKTKLYGDKRCIYCGVWFHWCQDDAQKWVKAENIDPHNVDTVLEPLHCGNGFCDDYHHTYLKAQERKAIAYAAQQKQRGLKLFKNLKASGVIA